MMEAFPYGHTEWESVRYLPAMLVRTLIYMSTKNDKMKKFPQYRWLTGR